MNQRWSELVETIGAHPHIDKVEAARDAAFASAFSEPHPALSSARAEEIDRLLTLFLEQHYGSLKSRVLLNFLEASQPPDDPELCFMFVETVRFSLSLSAPDRQDAIRALFHALAIEEPSDNESTNESAQERSAEPANTEAI